MAHGLMSHGEFFAWPVVYLWWLAFRFCMLPLLVRLAPQTAAEVAAAEGEGEVAPDTRADESGSGGEGGRSGGMSADGDTRG